MARALDGLLEEDPSVAECAAGLAHRLGDGGSEFLPGRDATHAAASSAGHRLHEDRKSDVVGLGQQDVDVVGCGRRAEHRHVGGEGVLLRGDLVSGHLEHPGRRSDEDDAVRRGLLRQLRILR